MPLRFAEPSAEAYQFPLTIRHLLDGVLAKSGHQEIVYRDQDKYDYATFFRRVGRLASLLKEAGVNQGTTVAVMDWNSHRYLEAYFAVPMMGAVLQTVNVRLPLHQIAYTLEQAQAEVVLVHRDFFPMIEHLLRGLPRIKAVIAILDGVEEETPAWACGEYEELSAAASPDYAFEDFDENALATTFFTTGTTGNPKGVSFTHRQLVLHALGFCGAFGASTAAVNIGVTDVYMPLTPMFHVHAWGVPYAATMLGVKQVYPGRYEPAMICRLRTEHKVTYSHCVPTILEMVIRTADETGTDLSGWRMTIGGSKLSKALCAEGQRRGMQIGGGYGMSETCPLVSMAACRFPDQSASPEAVLSTLTEAGVTVPLVSVEIVDEILNPLPHDGETRGELVVRAPWLTLGYAGGGPASDALWRGGWLHTQDVATIDARGQIQIRDRLKDVVKTGGEWIDSIQLEELVATADGILEAAVIAVPDAKWGERPLAIVVAASGRTIDLDLLNAPVTNAINGGLITRYAKLSRFEVVAQLPRTSVGKIDKKALRAIYADGALPDGNTACEP